MRAPGVILAVTGSRESTLAARIDAHRDLTVVRRCADLAEAVAAAAAGLGQVVMVSDQRGLTRDVIAHLTSAAVRVVGVATDASSLARLTSLGVPQVLPVDADDDQMVEVVASLAAGTSAMPTPPVPPRPPRAGTTLAVWGPTGAPGRTTLAVNVAAELASAGRQVLLVDADTYGGAVAQALGLLDESPGLAAVARAALTGVVDDGVLDRYALTVRPGLRVLTGISRPGRWSELPGAALEHAWPAMALAADAVVIDCGFSLEADEALTFDTRAPQRNAATLTALAAADAVVAVGSAEPLSVMRLIHALPRLAECTSAQPIVVANRVRAEVAGTRPDEAIADALARFAGIGDTWMVPWDPSACDAAVLAGQTLAERAPRSRARRAIGAVAAHVDQHHVAARATPRAPHMSVRH